jgi:hypothetical protein
MSDLVVTVPKPLWLDWIAKGDAAGDPETGGEWAFYVGGGRPPIEAGERLYIVAWDLIRGFAPVTRVAQTEKGWAICRRGGAVAVTVPEELVRGFRGYRRVWWNRSQELPFPGWKAALVG